MKKDDLQSVLIGRDVDIYKDLARLVRKIDSSSRFKQVELTQESIVATLKKVTGPSLIFISDEVPFPLELLSDLTWQHCPDAIVVIVTVKAKTVSIKELFNNTQFSRINLNKNNSECFPILQFLIQSTREKAAFRRCKNLLGVSEKRCQWLVDSSREAIAFVSRDVHWYANAAYLELFGATSNQELRSIALKDFILADEYLLFDSFLQKQDKVSGKTRSILLSMKKLNGSTFRANIYSIPSVFKGNKCHQLWVREVSSRVESSDDLELADNKNELEKAPVIVGKTVKPKPSKRNPFSEILNPKSIIADAVSESPVEESELKSETVINKTTYTESSLLKGVIRRKEARLLNIPLKSLKDTNDKKQRNHFISLKVAVAQKKGVDQLLMDFPESFNQQMRSVFWDKVKLSRLIQVLLKKGKISNNLFLRISEASVQDESFINWLIPGLKRLGEKQKNLTFLIPSNINPNQNKRTLKFIKELRKLGCKVALDGFVVNKNTIALLKYIKPEFVRVSLPWARQFEGDDKTELRLSGVIRQLENKAIKVIIPCGLSKNMRKVLTLSGASFCQEKTVKVV